MVQGGHKGSPYGEVNRTSKQIRARGEVDGEMALLNSKIISLIFELNIEFSPNPDCNGPLTLRT
jgi:hypothetical protein